MVSNNINLCFLVSAKNSDAFLLKRFIMFFIRSLDTIISFTNATYFLISLKSLIVSISVDMAIV